MVGLAVALVVGCDASPQTKTTDQARLDQIALVFESGRTVDAISQLHAYLSDHPTDDLGWTILGNAYIENDQLDEAIKSFKTALRHNPDRYQAVSGQGIIHRKRGEYEDAMASYRAAIKIDPSYAEAYSSMTVVALKLGQDEDALKFAMQGYELEGDHAGIAANLAVAYHYNNDTANRDRMTVIADNLGYDKVATLQQIYSGELSIRDGDKTAAGSSEKSKQEMRETKGESPSP
jgi:tetratricopeptide (TPR) repeat protein